MYKKQEKIAEVYGPYYEVLKKYIDDNGYLDKKVFTETDFRYEQLPFGCDHIGNICVPIPLRRIKYNQGWKISSEMQEDFKNGTFYHLANKNEFSNTNFVYRGVFKYEDGFFEDGYHIKPFPTHYIEIKQPEDAVY